MQTTCRGCGWQKPPGLCLREMLCIGEKCVGRSAYATLEDAQRIYDEHVAMAKAAQCCWKGR